MLMRSSETFKILDVTLAAILHKSQSGLIHIGAYPFKNNDESNKGSQTLLLVLQLVDRNLHVSIYCLKLQITAINRQRSPVVEMVFWFRFSLCRLQKYHE